MAPQNIPRAINVLTLGNKVVLCCVVSPWIVLLQMLKEQFKEFARETESIGQERVASANEICDQLIALDHSDSATIAEWKDNVNEAWADLLELIDTRTQLLQASWELHKFYYECKDTLERIYVSGMLLLSSA